MEITGRKRDPALLILAAVYLSIAVVMYYFHEESLSLGFDVMYEYLCGILLILLSFFVLLVRTNLDRGRVVARCALLLLTPYIATIIISLPLWFFNTADLVDIRKGIFGEIYKMIGVLAMAGFVYVFGRDGWWLNLLAMVAANLITVVRLMLKGGISTYLWEFWKLMISFAGETGELIQQAEIHELTFALGVCSVCFLTNWEEIRERRFVRLLIFPVLFCYLSGFKRIGIAASLTAAGAYLVIKPFLRKGRGRFLPFLASLAGAVLCFIYVVIVKEGLYEFLTTRLGIDTMGRLYLSEMIDSYYWIGLDYVGNGVGFVTRMFADLRLSGFSIHGLHNDILKLYIETGIWGLGIWMACFLPLRVWKTGKWQGTEGGLSALCLSAYVLVTAASDSTLSHFYTACALAISIMSCRLEEQERALAEERRSRRRDWE